MERSGRIGRLSLVLAVALLAVVSMIVLAGGVASGAGTSASAAYEYQYGKKVTICHHADAANLVTITISSSALPAHLAHGDTIGPCPPS